MSKEESGHHFKILQNSRTVGTKKSHWIWRFILSMEPETEVFSSSGRE